MTITFLAPDGVPLTAQQERQANAARHGGGSGRQLGGRSGFRVGTPSNVLTATSTTWTLGPCAAELDPGATTHQGMYGWATDANVSGAVTAADSTYARKDIVYIRVSDASAGDGTSGTPTAPVLYLAGTPAADPDAPDLPPRSFLVGTINMPVSGGGAPTVVLNPARYVSAGGIQPVFDTADLATFTPYPGFTIQRMDLPGMPLFTHDGTAYNPVVGGIKYFLEVDAASNGFSSGEWFMDQINNVALVKGHKYELTYQLVHNFVTEANIPFAINFKKSATSDTGTTGTAVGDSSILWSAPATNSGKTSVARAFYTPTADETVRILVTTGRLSGSSLYNISSRVLTIEDKGYLP